MSNAWSDWSSGATVPELSEIVRHQAQELQSFDQLCNPPEGKALGLNSGDEMKYIYYANISVSGGVLNENEEMPEGGITPIIGSYTLQEYGNSAKYTGKLEALSRLTAEDQLMVALINDMRKAQNTAAFTEFNSTKWFATFNSTADEFIKTGLHADFTNVANEDLTLDNLTYVVLKAKQNMIPTYDGESHVYVTGAASLRSLSRDSASGGTLDLLKRDSGRAALNAELGRIGGCRLVEDNHLIVDADDDGGAGAATGAGANLQVGFLVGADAVINEYAIAPEIRRQVKDFDRQKGVAWYFIAAWKKIYSQTLHSREHVIKVTAK